MQRVAFNMESWNEGMWPGFVTDKNETMPREKWLEALEFSVGVFRKGPVTTVLIAGLEPKESDWEGLEWLAKIGIYGVPILWPPMRGSRLEGHQTPTTTWHLEVAARTLDNQEKYGLDAHRHSSGGLNY